MTDTITVPIRATYRMTDDGPVRIDAEYAEIPVDAFIQFIAKGLGIPLEKREGAGPCS